MSFENRKFVEGRILRGWGVVRSRPWHFAGLFPTQAAAQAVAGELGPDYKVGMGAWQEGSDDFIWDEGHPDPAPAVPAA